MDIQAINPGIQGIKPEGNPSVDAVRRERAQFIKDKTDQKTTEAIDKQVQPEELLQNIKALTEDGLYSVRFEMSKDTSDMIINLIESETGEVIRQIPPDEILGMRKILADLRGNIVETKS